MRELSGVEIVPGRSSDDFAGRVQLCRRIPIGEMLHRLHQDHGLSWVVIAQIAQVSHPAVLKWKEGKASPERERVRRLCRLAAFCDIVSESGNQPTTWLAVVLDESDHEPSTLRVSDVATADRFELAIAHFRGRVSDEHVLYSVFPARPRAVGNLQIEWDVDASSGEARFFGQVKAFQLSSEHAQRSQVLEELVEKVREYVDDWYADLRHFSPHKERRELVFEASDLIDAGDLQSHLLGE